jgi:hypothetical protein
MVVLRNRQEVQLGHITRMTVRLLGRSHPVTVGRVTMQVPKEHLLRT